jgi:hypothetical protein
MSRCLAAEDQCAGRTVSVAWRAWYFSITFNTLLGERDLLGIARKIARVIFIAMHRNDISGSLPI